MDSNTLFHVANITAFACWLILLAGLFWPAARSLARLLGQAIIPILFGSLYCWFLFSSYGQTDGSFTSLTGVRSLFSNDGILLAGWLHYLIFDLFIGTWVRDDAEHWAVNRLALIPCLVLCFLMGPFGLLLYLLLRPLAGNKPALAS